jgi:hypothetical protein
MMIDNPGGQDQELRDPTGFDGWLVYLNAES